MVDKVHFVEIESNTGADTRGMNRVKFHPPPPPLSCLNHQQCRKKNNDISAVSDRHSQGVSFGFAIALKIIMEHCS
jgi:hypothetical protein